MHSGKTVLLFCYFSFFSIACFAAELARYVPKVWWTEENFELHIKWDDLNADMDGEGNTALHLSIKHNRIATFKKLVDCKADLERRSRCGRTALCLAAYMNDVQKVNYLLAHHANPQALRIMHDGYEVKETVLHNAANRGSKELIETLIRAGVDPRARDYFNSTALHYARGHAVGLLIAQGVDVNAENDRKELPIHCAAQYASGKEVLWLVVAGSNLHATNAAGKTALQLATERVKDKQDWYESVQEDPSLPAENKECFAQQRLIAQDVLLALTVATVRKPSAMVDRC